MSRQILYKGTLPWLMACVYDWHSSRSISPVINLPLSSFGLTRLNIRPLRVVICSMNSGRSLLLEFLQKIKDLFSSVGLTIVKQSLSLKSLGSFFLFYFSFLHFQSYHLKLWGHFRDTLSNLFNCHKYQEALKRNHAQPKGKRENIVQPHLDLHLLLWICLSRAILKDWQSRISFKGHSHQSFHWIINKVRAQK
jgi:hypothetical protein